MEGMSCCVAGWSSFLVFVFWIAGVVWGINLLWIIIRCWIRWLKDWWEEDD